jgi:uncharacterized repeat protein (TIGR03803 family)
MRRKSAVRIIVGILAMLAVMSVSGDGAWSQVKFKTLHRFTGGKDGASPYTALIFDKLGNLYGTTASGGANHAGTVFSLTPTGTGGWTESVLYSFTGGGDGANPYAGLISDSAGNLYGTTANGGSTNCKGCGTVFKLALKAKGGWTESVLYSFLGRLDGGYPFAALIFDGAGNLYGTTTGGGPGDCSVNNIKGCGVIFKLTPGTKGGWTESVLYSFSGGNDGAFPYDALIFDAAGNLYGTTVAGGTGGLGAVFSLTPNSQGWTETVLRNINAEPQAGLIFDSAGNLYGTTVYGAKGYGTVFELSPTTGGWTYRGVRKFTGKDGATPTATLIFDHSGHLYGTTTAGGAFGNGVVFKLTPNSHGGWTERVLWDFQGHAGAHPAAALLLDDAGNLYGTTTGDGKTTFGSVFEITP